MTATPKRIQLRRTKGWRKPEGAVVVARPSRWGNPFRVDPSVSPLGDGITDDVCSTSDDAVTRFRGMLLWPLIGEPSYPDSDEIRYALRGKDLACWCPLDQPCHADVLLEVANR